MRAIDRLIDGSLPFLVSAALIALIAAFASCQQHYEKKEIKCGPKPDMNELKRRINRATDSAIEKEFTR